VGATELEWSASAGSAVTDPATEPSDRVIAQIGDVTVPPGGDDAGARDAVAVDHEPPLATRGVAGLWALFLGLALLMVGNGLNASVIGVRSASEGFTLAVTGFVMAGYFAGFLLAPSVVVRMIPSVGHIRVFAGLASTASSAVLVHSLVVTPMVWTAMRFVFGFCAAGLYVVIESWLSEASDASNRGRTLAVYMIVSMGGLAIGQLLLSTGDPNGFTLFVLASVLVSLSLVPVTLAATTRPPPVRRPDTTSIRELGRAVPTGVIGALLNGAAVGALLGMGAVYATAAGLSVQRTGFFLAAPVVGAILFQWPVGWVSDRVSRRSVMLRVVSTAAVAAVALALTPEQDLAVFALMVVLGGATFPMYSLVIAYTLDWTPVVRTVSTSAALVRINGIGAVTGPIIAALLMAAIDEHWFFWTLAATNAAMAAFVTYRIASKRPLPTYRQRRFVTVPARASELVMRLAPRPRWRSRS
jgi:MFS family permease